MKKTTGRVGVICNISYQSHPPQICEECNGAVSRIPMSFISDISVRALASSVSKAVPIQVH